ncbi:(2E,6E)-farnesyl diphosphate synthase [Orbaceae bacterium ac157xtp]
MNKIFSQIHHTYSQRINHFLDDYINACDPSDLRDAMAYSLLVNGKRIRPCLVYATGAMFGCDLALLDYPAAAIELIHTYSLIHDDLPAMDDDNLRRGMPTCHIKFGEATAILAGDALQTLAFSLLAESTELTASCKVNLIKELALASGVKGMCLGQSLDLIAEKKIINIDALNHIHANKTGALIKAAVRMGMFTAGGEALNYQTHLDRYADAIGLAFQIQDDVLDVIGDEKLIGKHVGSDQHLQKNTYVSLLGLEQAQLSCQQLYDQAINELNKIPANSEILHQLANFIIHRHS